MLSFAWLLLFLGGGVYLAYQRIDLRTSTVAANVAVAAYSVYTFAGHGSWIYMLLLWIALAALIVPNLVNLSISEASRVRMLTTETELREEREKTPNLLCNRCGAAIGNNASTCVSCGADSFVRATYEAGEAPIKWNGCLAAAGGFGIAGALAIFGLLFAFAFALGWLNDHVLCMFSTGSCKW